MTSLLVFGLGPWEIALIVLAVLVLFGAKKIPEFAKGMGQGIREFKNAANNVRSEIDKEAEAVKNTAAVKEEAASKSQ